jgi:hypothetical protein
MGTIQRGMTEDADEHKLRNSVVPMAGAAALAYQRILGDDYRSANLNRIEIDLNDLANALAKLVTLYTFAADGSGLRKLSSEETAKAYFLNKGHTLYFKDGSKPTSRIAIHQSELKQAIEQLRNERRKKALDDASAA